MKIFKIELTDELKLWKINKIENNNFKFQEEKKIIIELVDSQQLNLAKKFIK